MTIKPQTIFDEEIDDETQDIVEETDDASKSWTSLGFEEPLVIAMVGLPARGKSYISKMLMVLPKPDLPNPTQPYPPPSQTPDVI